MYMIGVGLQVVEGRPENLVWMAEAAGLEAAADSLGCISRMEATTTS